MQPSRNSEKEGNLTFPKHVEAYRRRFDAALEGFDWQCVDTLATELLDCWKNGRQVFICGNGGSAANAIHIANDFLYGISKRKGSGLRVNALPGNSSVLTCLANDEGYASIFSYQLATMANKGDVLIVLSGSGNSENIVEAAKTAKELGLKTFAILGYTGGKVKSLVQVPIHFAVEDMQISEDLQMYVAHIVSQWLYEHRDQALKR